MIIYKYTLSMEHQQDVEMPEGAQLLSVQVQNSAVQLWALVDPTAPTVTRKIVLCATGEPIHVDLGQFISTFQLLGGSVVFHAFEAAW